MLATDLLHVILTSYLLARREKRVKKEGLNCAGDKAGLISFGWLYTY